MKASLAGAILALAAAAIPMGAAAQQIQETTASAGTIVVPAGPPFAAATVRTFTYQPVCEVYRVQFADEYGWRVRDVRICY
jgi:hypothetical protein